MTVKVRSSILIVGPTASGKSALAVSVAESLGGEIISADSMQVYRGLDIGTAKPSGEERARVPHHLIDVLDLTEFFDAAKFIHLAREAERGIRARGRVPIFCGGTGLYVKAYLEGLGVAPASDPQLRAQLEKMPLEELTAELRERDPELWERIDRNNPRRVVRAIEVIRLTGQAYSEQRARWNERLQSASAAASNATLVFGLQRGSDELRHRIDTRVDEMFSRGLVEETRALLARGLERNATAMQAIGYRQVVEHLRGERDLQETIELVKTKTRQFAKRQMTWFRRQLSVTWLAPDVAHQQLVDLVSKG